MVRESPHVGMSRNSVEEEVLKEKVGWLRLSTLVSNHHSMLIKQLIMSQSEEEKEVAFGVTFGKPYLKRKEGKTTTTQSITFLSNINIIDPCPLAASLLLIYYYYEGFSEKKKKGLLLKQIFIHPSSMPCQCHNH